MLDCLQVRKHAFNHISNTLILKPMGIVVHGGNSTGDLLVKAFEGTSLKSVAYELRDLPEYGYARNLVGVGISDREFYTRDYNNPLFSER